MAWAKSNFGEGGLPLRTKSRRRYRRFLGDPVGWGCSVPRSAVFRCRHGLL